jgi:hypothetical protein
MSPKNPDIWSARWQNRPEMLPIKPWMGDSEHSNPPA